METDLDTLATALYVIADDLLKEHPEVLPYRPIGGIEPKISDAEMITLAVMQGLMDFSNESKWVRYARRHLTDQFRAIPTQSGYNKRLRKLADLMCWLIPTLAQTVSVYTDDVWVADSTPVECARSRETVKRSDLAGFAEYGYCASHSRFFWGLRLHMLATLDGLPIAFAITGAKANERDTLLGMLDGLPTTSDQLLLADKGYNGARFETELGAMGIELVRPARKGEDPRPGHQFLRPLRQRIEAIFDTYKDQLGLERHKAHTPRGVITRILQRILALTAAIWHNDNCGAETLRSLTPYDH